MGEAVDRLELRLSGVSGYTRTVDGKMVHVKSYARAGQALVRELKSGDHIFTQGKVFQIEGTPTEDVLPDSTYGKRVRLSLHNREMSFPVRDVDTGETGTWSQLSHRVVTRAKPRGALSLHRKL